MAGRDHLSRPVAPQPSLRTSRPSPAQPSPDRPDMCVQSFIHLFIHCQQSKQGIPTNTRKRKVIHDNTPQHTLTHHKTDHLSFPLSIDVCVCVCMTFSWFIKRDLSSFRIIISSGLSICRLDCRYYCTVYF